MSFIDELRWRGMLHDLIPGTEEELAKGMTSGYIGFDPTADSLHVGHLTQIMTLIHFQRAGHKPIALVGGATGMIGDPSFKSQERNLLDEETLNKNVLAIKLQLEKFLEFDAGQNSAELVNNYDWFKEFRFLDFIRDVGKHITVNYMMAKESVKKRLDGDTGLSFTEFTYQLLQGYDFYWLWKNKGCKVQMGGSDQWGNLLTGSELIRRKDGGTAYAITTQLIKKSDGTKFGKTESGAVWLDPKRTSPYRYYQFWLNASDEDTKEWIRIFSLNTRKEIESLEAEHEKAPGLRILQKALAEEITTRTHSKEAYQTAVKTSEFLFDNGSVEFLHGLKDDEVMEVFDGVPKFEIQKIELTSGITATDLLAERTKVFSSKGEARKMIQGGGVAVNRNKLVDVNASFGLNDLLNDKFLVIQKGKKNYFLVVMV